MKYTGNMDKDLKILIPEGVADGVTPNRYVAERLVAKAKRIYQLNVQWGKTITDTNKGRDRLNVFMRHWYDAYLKTGEVK